MPMMIHLWNRGQFRGFEPSFVPSQPTMLWSSSTNFGSCLVSVPASFMTDSWIAVVEDGAVATLPFSTSLVWLFSFISASLVDHR